MIFLFKKNIKRCFAWWRGVVCGGKQEYFLDKRILLFHSVGGTPRDHKLAIRVPIEGFKRHLEYLVSCGYKAITVSELVENGLKRREDKLISITFDDGYKDNIEIAAPILQQLGLTATFFITVSYVSGSVKKKWADGNSREYMDWRDVIKLSEMGFEIGSHMLNHVDLTALNDAELIREFTDSKKVISGHTGKETKVFSYPYGKINQKVVAAAKGAGYIGGCSSFFGFNNVDTDRYVLKRTEIDGYDTAGDFRNKLKGCYD